jgi:hypothetical protein
MAHPFLSLVRFPFLRADNLKRVILAGQKAAFTGRLFLLAAKGGYSAASA